MGPLLKVTGLRKDFLLHQQGGARIAVLDGLGFDVMAGEAVAVTGPSGKGKSSLLKLIYGTYRASGGHILVSQAEGWVDVATASPQEVIGLRRSTIGYITQFLRVIPRVPAEDIVAEPLLERGMEREAALARARNLLDRLNIPQRLWHLSPLTFSGGEQQRVNIARGFAAPYPLLLIDEPTASLDKANRLRVLEMVEEARGIGCAVVGVFHDDDERRRVCTCEINLA
jgi:alpha-D-ribose 1-methylphosphonate 5-triphosphate synthase subunit PhnL